MNEVLRCIFCNSNNPGTVTKLGYTCKQCLQQYIEEAQTKPEIAQQILKPKKIVELLDKYIAGQTDAKIALSVAGYIHQLKILNPDDEIEKANIMLFGPTGSGKTELIKILAKVLSLDLVICDATCLTEAGYVGEDVESVLHKLHKHCNGDLARTCKGIICIDEIDKVTKKSNANSGISRDVSGEGVQQAFLKMIEGNIIKVPVSGNKRTPNQEYIEIDTSNILFIFLGAFQGIEKIANKRIYGSSIGLTNSTDLSNINNSILHDDLVQYGMIPEFMGRIPLISYVKKLSLEEMKSVLYQVEGSIVHKYQTLFKIMGIELKFTDEILHKIAQKATNSEFGARYLKSILHKNMIQYVYNTQEPFLEINDLALDS